MDPPFCFHGSVQYLCLPTDYLVYLDTQKGAVRQAVSGSVDETGVSLEEVVGDLEIHAELSHTV
jgi:hypothetical protein